MQTIAIGNHKGGTGKTTTAYNLGHELAARRRVLLVDLDYQASLSSIAGIDAGGGDIAQVLGNDRAPARSVIRELGRNLAILPSAIDLADVEAQLVNRIGRENVLRRALASVGDDFDVALIDCPPSLGVLTVNALAAAAGVLAVSTPTGVDLRALELFLSTVDEVKREINPGLELVGILLTSFDQRYGHHQDVAGAMTSGQLPLLPVTIPRSVRVAESATAHQSVAQYAPGHPAALAYHELGRILESWLNDRKSS